MRSKKGKSNPCFTLPLLNATSIIHRIKPIYKRERGIAGQKDGGGGRNYDELVTPTNYQCPMPHTP